MTFADILRQGGKWTKGKFYVRSVSPPEETRTGGFCQTIQVIDSRQMEETVNLFCTDDPLTQMKESEVGERWIEIRWRKDEKYYQGQIAKPEPITWATDDSPNWDKIALGKCRHGILCAYIQHDGLPIGMTEIGTDCPDPTLLKLINMLAKFSMTGEIDE